MTGLAGESKKILVVAVFASHAGKAVVQIATVEITVNDLLEIGTEETVGPLESILVDSDEGNITLDIFLKIRKNRMNQTFIAIIQLLTSQYCRTFYDCVSIPLPNKRLLAEALLRKEKDQADAQERDHCQAIEDRPEGVEIGNAAHDRDEHTTHPHRKTHHQARNHRLAAGRQFLRHDQTQRLRGEQQTPRQCGR